MNKKVITVLTCEDEKLVRMGIKSVLEQDGEIKISCETETGKDTVDKAAELAPDVILLDLKLPDMSGLTVINKLKELSCNSKIAVLTCHDNKDEIKNALSCGIYAYIMKDIPSEKLPEIIKTVDSGAMWLDPKAVDILRNGNNDNLFGKKVSGREFKNTHANLTSREYEVLKLLVDGMSNIKIAQTLNISEHTAKAHVCNIIQKLLVDDRTQAAVKAVKEGLV